MPLGFVLSPPAGPQPRVLCRSARLITVDANPDCCMRRFLGHARDDDKRCLDMRNLRSVADHHLTSKTRNSRMADCLCLPFTPFHCSSHPLTPAPHSTQQPLVLSIQEHEIPLCVHGLCDSKDHSSSSLPISIQLFIICACMCLCVQSCRRREYSWLTCGGQKITLVSPQGFSIFDWRQYLSLAWTYHRKSQASWPRKSFQASARALPIQVSPGLQAHASIPI